MADDKKKDGEKKEETPKRDWGKLLPAAFMIINVVFTVGGAALVYLSTVGFHKAPVTEETAKEEIAKKVESSSDDAPVIFNMEPIIVNLDGRPRRTMKAAVSVELLDNKGFEDLVNLGAQTRDSIVKLLGSKTFAEVESVQGKLFLKDEIANILNRHIHDGVVKDIYFTELVVQ